MSGLIDLPARTVVFGWEGTAVPDRTSDASAVRRRVERLTELGVDLVAVSSTNVGHVDGQMAARPPGPGRLFVCASRESEVFRIDAGGPRLVWARRATRDEEAGLTAARVTSDGKRAEIDLTDEAHVIVWVRDHLLGVDDPEGLLVIGDRFGSAGGVPGSDARMLEVPLPGARFVSVGDEPGGVPAGVRHVGGGPARFLEVLDELERLLLAFPEPIGDLSWRLDVEGFEPLMEREVESWLTVSNGRLGTRGSLEEGSEESSPATYLAGFFGRPEGDAGPELVSGPGWTGLRPTLDGRPLDLDRGETLEHRRTLDLRRGILFRLWRQRSEDGAELRYRSARFASLADRGLGVLQVGSDASGADAGLADGVAIPSPGGPVEAVEAREDDGGLAIRILGRSGGAAAFSLRTEPGNGRLLRLAAAVAGDRGEDVNARAHRALERVGGIGIERLRAEHEVAWRERWRQADVVVEGDPEAQRALRFALYHLIASADPECDRASVGARGLTGPGYRGHVFWDTDVFVVPFFILTHPPTARAHLAYRYRGLPGARAKAARLGFRGALYAWEAADTGEEVTPPEGIGPDGRPVPILTGVQEHHISADVAWAVWRYVQSTGDEGFLLEMGAEMILETSRFWASRARRGRDGRYHIARVIGPDEYHETVRDSAFTNVMARWNLERGLELAKMLVETDPGAWRDLASRLGLRGRELARWQGVAEGLADGFDPASLLYEQFEGYFDLEDVRAVDLGPRPFAADVVLGRRRLQRSQVVKQADVVMLAHMLPEVVPPEVAAANYRYYEPRTSHGSSLSPAIHAAVAACGGDLEGALSYFRMAATIDLGDGMGSSGQGIHMATQGGLWQAAVMGFGGFRAQGDVVRLDPALPPGWTRLAFPIRWRGAALLVDARADRIELTAHGMLNVALGPAPPTRLGPGRYLASRDAAGWSGWQGVSAP